MFITKKKYFFLNSNKMKSNQINLIQFLKNKIFKNKILKINFIENNILNAKLIAYTLSYVYD